MKAPRAPKTVQTTAPASDGVKRVLPEDPKELDRVIGPYRILVGPLVNGASVTCEAFDVAPFDASEREVLTQAGAALAYQEGGVLDARWLFALAVVGVATPRVLTFVNEKRKSDSQKVEAKVEALSKGEAA